MGSDDSFVYCLKDGSKGGQLVWKFPTGGPVRSSPAVADHDVYVASYDGFLYCLSEENADLVFKHEVGGLVYSSPTIAAQKLYVCHASVICLKD